MGLLDNKRALVIGVASNRSIAWGIAKIIAEKIERYSDKTPAIHFSKGVIVHFYNDSAVITSTLTAEKATIDDKNQQMTH